MTKTLCMALWNHAHISAVGDRRLCCISTEENPPKGSTPLEEYWNSDFVKEARRKMLAGELVHACSACNQFEYGPNTQRDYYNKQWASMIPELEKVTNEDGSVSFMPSTFDYRSTLCDFKCRTCGPSNSSTWEMEEKTHGLDKKTYHHDVTSSDRDILDAIESGALREIYWAGGEPLIMKRHWDIMNALSEHPLAKEVSIRYSTNLHTIKRGDLDLIEILSKFKSITLFASQDGAGKIAEFIRTGLVWDKWTQNLKEIKNRNLPQMTLIVDVTLTIPGLLCMDELLEFTNQLGFIVIAKVMSTGGSWGYLSPLFLPKELRDDLCESVLQRISPHRRSYNEEVFRAIEGIKSMKVFEEIYDPIERDRGILHGLREAKRLAAIRGDGQDGKLSLEDIYERHNNLRDWWLSLRNFRPRWERTGPPRGFSG